MRANPESDVGAAVDRAVSRALDRRYANLSRRSFLSLLTRRLVGLTGIVVAAEVFPYLASTAHAAFSECGLHGWICGTGNCSGGTAGQTWVQCCELPQCPPKWKCCTYRDYCGTPPPNHPTNCQGVEPSGTLWCNNGEYICTTIACAGNYSSPSSCTSGCGISLCGT